MRRRKAGTGFGPAPLEWPDIDAFVRNARQDLAPWEIEMIEMVDDLYLAADRDRQAEAAKKRKEERDSKK